VQPLADLTGLAIAIDDTFDESADAAAAAKGIRQLAGGGGVTVVCSQGGAIPSALLHLGVRWEGHGPAAGQLFPPAAKGSVWVLGGRPGALFGDYYRNLDPDPDAPS